MPPVNQSRLARINAFTYQSISVSTRAGWVCWKEWLTAVKASEEVTRGRQLNLTNVSCSGYGRWRRTLPLMENAMFKVFIDGNDDRLRLEDPEGRNIGWIRGH